MPLVMHPKDIGELLGTLIGAASSTRFWENQSAMYPSGEGVFLEQNARALVAEGLAAYATMMKENGGMEKFDVDVETESGFVTVKNVTHWTVGEDGILHVMDGDTIIGSFADMKWHNVVRADRKE